jgi:predicted Zn-dependent protease
MNQTQQTVLVLAVLLFAGMYFFLGNKPAAHRQEAVSQSLSMEATSSDALMRRALGALSPDSVVVLTGLEQALGSVPDDAARSGVLKSVAGFWFRNGQREASGLVAEQVAALDNTDAAWSVAGATYFEALRNTSDTISRSFCAQRAVKAFENAASLNPNEPEHRVNLALVYAEQPPPDNPMQAVMILRDLEQKFPEAPAVYNALGRLAIKTGQWERAITRLEKALSLEPQNKFTICLLANAYEGAGQSDKAVTFSQRCSGDR